MKCKNCGHEVTINQFSKKIGHVIHEDVLDSTILHFIDKNCWCGCKKPKEAKR